MVFEIENRYNYYKNYSNDYSNGLSNNNYLINHLSTVQLYNVIYVVILYNRKKLLKLSPSNLRVRRIYLLDNFTLYQLVVNLSLTLYQILYLI